MAEISPEEQAQVEATYNRMAAASIDWTIENFASKAVELLILDEGNLNKYERTIETILTVFQRTERLKAGPRGEAKQASLDLALCYLIKHEPGDSRAVSNEFVAMSDIAANESFAEASLALVLEALHYERKEKG